MSGEEIAVALAAILLGSAIKSISGMGLPLVSIPIISFVTDLETAVAAVAIPNLLINVAMAWRSRESRAEAETFRCWGRPASSAASSARTPSCRSASTARRSRSSPLSRSMSSPSCGCRTSGSRLRPATSCAWCRSRHRTPSRAIGISGPLIGSWVHCYRLERRAHIFSITTLFALAGAAQLVALLIAGELSGRWTVAVLGCLPALATVPFGEHLRNRFSSEGSTVLSSQRSR